MRIIRSGSPNASTAISVMLRQVNGHRVLIGALVYRRPIGSLIKVFLLASLV
jgi:hypothetical protein